MFVPYFLFSNVNFKGTVRSFYYQEILGFRDKAYQNYPTTFYYHTKITPRNKGIPELLPINISDINLSSL